MEKAISKTPIERGQIACFLGLYAPAPEGAPKDWYHHGDENTRAWIDYFNQCEEQGYFSVPVGGANVVDRKRLMMYLADLELTYSPAWGANGQGDEKLYWFVKGLSAEIERWDS